MEIEMGTNVVDTTNYYIAKPIDPYHFSSCHCPRKSPIKADTKVDNIIEAGSWEQACIAEFFDENSDSIIDKYEADRLNTSNVFFSPPYATVCIQDIATPQNVQVFENLAIPKSNEYYATGSVPVAVIDGFISSESHGTIVANILKQNNPDIAVTRYNCSDEVKIVVEVDNKPAKHLPCNRCHGDLGKVSYKVIEANPYEELKRDVASGKKYAAINLSMAVPLSYDTINELCYDKLKVKLTPENIAQYKTQIKNILYRKWEENPKHEITRASDGEKVSIQYELGNIKILDSLNIPVYVAQAYKFDNYTNETFNLFSLINTAVTVEAGTETTRPYSSSNSFAIDEKTGKRRVTQCVVFTGRRIDKNSTSFATPEFLAKTLKKQPVNTAHIAETRTETTRPFRSSNSFAIDEPTEEKRIVQRLNRAGTVTDNFSTSPATLGFLSKVPKKQYRSCLK